MSVYVDKALKNISNRTFYADIFRLLAIFAIITLHASGNIRYYSNYADQFDIWLVGISYNSFFIWGTGAFIMISGLFMLQPKRTEDLGKFFKGRVIRILIPFLVWAVIYYVYFHWTAIKEAPGKSLEGFFRDLLTGNLHFHLWFVYMIFAMYLISPVLSVFVNKAPERILKYYFVFWFISLFLPFIDKFSGNYPLLLRYLDLNNYAGIFMLGYYLDKKEVKIKSLWLILGIALIGIFGILSTVWLSKYTGNNDYFFMKRLNPNIVLLILCVYFLIRKINWKKVYEKKPKIMSLLVKYSSLSYGIFLVHAMVLELLRSGVLGFKITFYLLFDHQINAWLGTAILTILCFILSIVIVSIINKIPKVSKYLI